MLLMIGGGGRQCEDDGGLSRVGKDAPVWHGFDMVVGRGLKRGHDSWEAGQYACAQRVARLMPSVPPAERPR